MTGSIPQKPIVYYLIGVQGNFLTWIGIREYLTMDYSVLTSIYAIQQLAI